MGDWWVAPWTRFSHKYYLYFLLDYPTENLGMPSRHEHILVSCQSGTRLIRIHVIYLGFTGTSKAPDIMKRMLFLSCGGVLWNMRSELAERHV